MRLPKYPYIPVTIFMFVGIFVGFRLDHDPAPLPAPPPVVKTETKTVIKTVHTPVQASACKESNRLAEQMAKAVEDYESVLGEETEVQADSFRAMMDKSVREMNAATAAHKKVIADTLDAALALADARKAFTDAQSECRTYPIR